MKKIEYSIYEDSEQNLKFPQLFFFFSFLMVNDIKISLTSEFDKYQNGANRCVLFDKQR